MKNPAATLDMNDALRGIRVTVTVKNRPSRLRITLGTWAICLGSWILGMAKPVINGPDE